MVGSKGSTQKASEAARKGEFDIFKNYDDLLGDNATRTANIKTIAKTGMYRVEAGCKDILLERGYKTRLRKLFFAG